MLKLRITGELSSPMEYSVEDLNGFDDQERIDDATQCGYKKGGKAIRFEAVLKRVQPNPNGQWMTLCAPTDPFFASIPLESLKREGVIIYANPAGKELDPEKDGPFRFFIPDAAKCGTEAQDECLNVKHLREISFSSEKGRDTRPEDTEDHRKLHQK